MATATKNISKTRQVINHLAAGRPLTATQAQNKYGVGNLRAMISTIRERVEAFGNWEITTSENSRGETVYSMTDTHPGSRTYGFDKNGNRYIL